MAARRSVSFPFSGNHGYIPNPRCSLLNGNLLGTTRMLMGNKYTLRHAERMNIVTADTKSMT